MTIDIPRLVAGCSDLKLLQQLISMIAPESVPVINWDLTGRALGQAVQQAVSTNAKAWVKLQQIASLSKNGRPATVRSVLYDDQRLRDQFDELDSGMQTAAIWLALNDEELFEHCLSALHVDQGLNKRSWRAYRVRLDKGAKLDFSERNASQFQNLVREAIRACGTFDLPGELATHHFHRVLFPEHSHSRRALEQVTVFAEARTVAEDVFVEARVETQIRKKVDSISVIFDRERRELDVVTIGGKAFIEQVAQAFFRAFLGQTPDLELLIRRKVSFHPLLRKFKPVLTDQSRFIRAKIDEIRLQSPSGGLHTIDAKAHRDSDIDVYDIAKRDFGDSDPFQGDGWTVVSGRVILFAVPSKPHLKPKLRTIDLKANGHTNLREQDDDDLYIADELLTRWGILEAFEDETDGD